MGGPIGHPADEVSVHQLYKNYQEGEKERAVLSDVNANFAPGAFHAIVGRSGSGKSTLLDLLSGINTPDRGIIRIAGHEINRVSEQQRTLLRRRHIGYIFQFFNLIPSLTAEENVMLPLELNGIGNKSERKQHVAHVLKQVGLADRMSSYSHALSGGEQQRVALARAIIHEPSVILADEPTGNLDDANAEMVLEMLMTMKGKRTLIVVTHSAEIAALADYRWQMRSGQLLSP